MPNRIGCASLRQFHHQEEHQEADDVILLREGALGVDRDPLVFLEEVIEGVGSDADVDGDDDVVGDRRQPRIEIVIAVHEQDLQDQRDRQQTRHQLQRAAEAGVEVPDQPDELDRREQEDQVVEIDLAFEPSHDAFPHVGEFFNARLKNKSGRARRIAARILAPVA